ncbi:MAG TPA: hypothetical protein EYP36_13305 [Calditrichaeota bacterium]|nr:hypothetical protein [Calditrichota bacterium]
MGKKSKNKRPELQNETTGNGGKTEEVEKIYKYITRIMSWTVGISAVLIILLPEFNSLILDRITQFLYYIFIITLLVFILFEFIGKYVKKLIRSSIG